jgi:hypothetical protein
LDTVTERNRARYLHREQTSWPQDTDKARDGSKLLVRSRNVLQNQPGEHEVEAGVWEFS